MKLKKIYILNFIKIDKVLENVINIIKLAMLL